MSFHLKIGLSFCSILLLTITVAAASWWGMDTALQRQDNIFAFSLEVDRLFNTLANGEHSYISTREIGYAHEVNKVLDELYLTIGEVHVKFNIQQHQKVDKVLAELHNYKENFSNFIQQMINMETMQSRMILESKRLLSNISTLTDPETGLSANILLQASRMFQKEKTYILSNSPESSQTILEIVTKIEKLAQQIVARPDDNNQRLTAYRISKVASVYHDIFRRYLDEQENLKQLIQFMHHSQHQLASELRTFVDKELSISQRQVNRLQLFTMMVSIFAILLSILITLFLSARITRPLEQLKNSAKDILHGKLDTMVLIHSKDEIGQLGGIFNQMTLKLRQNFEDIHLYRNHLEELVEERTLDLKKEVAERTSAEQALRASEERLRTIVDQSPMGIILWDTDFKVRQWNKAAETIFGYRAAEAIGMMAAQLLAESMQPHIEKIWHKLISTQTGIRSHNENIRKDGRIIHCDWFNSPIFDASGKILGALSLVENVTERIRTEKELLKIEKLESTGILAGGIAHDFNNILTAVLGNINLSLFDDNLSPKTRKLLISAEKASIRAKDLTQQLLTFAKGGEPIRESTSLAAIIRDSAAFVLHGGKVSCDYNLPDDLWYAIVDRGQISQVIQNIVLNARHSMPKGGTITIAGENVLPADDSFSLLNGKKIYVKISIRDSGIGIPPELLDKIFDPYFSTKQEGSGLGLAITHSIINKHHGHILVNSEQGKGTEFVIYLPATSQKTATTDRKPAITLPSKPKNILIMEDDEAVMIVLRTMLKTLGHSVFSASEGREAISIYSERFKSSTPIDLVIVDLTIPGGLGGRETIAELHKIDPNVRAIVSSGYSNDPVMASFKDYGFCASVAKPYVLHELSQAIEIVNSLDIKEKPKNP